MNKTLKRAVLGLASLSFAGLLVGCETLVLSDPGYSEASEAALRARVVAELREAQRLGLITTGEEDIPSFTDEQNRMVAAAGEGAAVAEVNRPK
jgi:hypothetical protein